MRQRFQPGSRRSQWTTLVAILVMLGITSSLLVGCGASQPAQAKTVKVGLLISLTGTMGGTGKAISDGVEFTFDEIVNKAGGIKALGGATLQIVRADTTSEPKVALSEMEKILTVEKPAVMIGPYASGEASSAAPLLDKNKIPGLSVRTTGDPIFPMNLQYWRTIAMPSSSYGALMVKQILDMKKEFGITTDRILLVAGDASWWRDYARKGARDAIDAAGLGANVVDDIMYDLKTKDLTPIVTRMKAAKPDVVIHGPYFEDAVLLHKARQALDFYPPVILGTDTGYTTPKVIDAIGMDMTNATVIGNGAFAVGYWSPAAPIKASQDVLAKAKDWTAAKKIEIDVDFMMGVQAALLVRRALETAASTEPEKINEAFRKMEVPLGDPDFLIPAFAPAIAWDPNGKPKNTNWMTVQWVDKDKWNVIYPTELRTGQPVFRK